MKTFIKATTWIWIVNELLGSQGRSVSWEKTSKTTGSKGTAQSDVHQRDEPPIDRRRFHQLFRQLQYPRESACRAGWQRDLGHFNDLLGITKVSGQEQRQRLVHHLRHWNIEGWERDDVDVLLHGAPQNPLLRPDLREPVRPGAQDGRHIINVHSKVHCACRLGRRMRPVLEIHLLSSGGVVQLLGQGHCDGHPLMPQHGAEPSLSASLKSTPRGLPARVHTFTGVANKKERARLSQTPLWCCCGCCCCGGCWWLLVVGGCWWQSALPPTDPPSANDVGPQNAAGFCLEGSWALR